MKKLLVIALILTMVLSGAVLAEAESANQDIGSVVAFGHYEQDNDMSNGKEPIEWIILDKREDGSVVLLSKYALDCKRYNDEYTSVAWGTCTLRTWLNEDFYNAAFSTEEQAKIKTVKVANEDKPYYATKGDEDMEDKVWLLSINEVTDSVTGEKVYSCFTDDSSRMCVPTKYAVAQGAYQSSDYTVDGVGTCWWWLRSPGYDRWYAAYVGIDGSVDSYGTIVRYDFSSVRPVMVVLP